MKQSVLKINKSKCNNVSTSVTKKKGGTGDMPYHAFKFGSFRSWHVNIELYQRINASMDKKL